MIAKDDCCAGGSCLDKTQAGARSTRCSFGAMIPHLWLTRSPAPTLCSCFDFQVLHFHYHSSCPRHLPPLYLPNLPRNRLTVFRCHSDAHPPPQLFGSPSLVCSALTSTAMNSLCFGGHFVASYCCDHFLRDVRKDVAS